MASAGDDFNLPGGTLIEAGIAAGNKVTIRGGQLATNPEDPDPTGSILTLAGTITANIVEIHGGSNLDYFDLINPAGINAPTTLKGYAGDDRFFIQTVPLAMSIDGGDGANRYYVSSNAARNLFRGNLSTSSTQLTKSLRFLCSQADYWCFEKVCFTDF